MLYFAIAATTWLVKLFNVIHNFRIKRKIFLCIFMLLSDSQGQREYAKSLSNFATRLQWLSESGDKKMLKT